jgi:hypothetical protein
MSITQAVIFGRNEWATRNQGNLGAIEAGNEAQSLGDKVDWQLKTKLLC